MRQPPRSTDFLAYVGSRDIHDGRISEFRTDPPLRRFEFAPWDEPIELGPAVIPDLEAAFKVAEGSEAAVNRWHRAPAVAAAVIAVAGAA